MQLYTCWASGWQTLLRIQASFKWEWNGINGKEKNWFLDIKSHLEGSLVRHGKGSFVREWKGNVCGVEQVIQCDLNVIHSKVAQMSSLS